MTVSNRIRRGRPAVLVSCLALGLAGCALFQPAAPPAPPPTPAAETVRLPPPPPRKPPVPSVARLPQTAPGERAGLDRLIGLDQTQVAEMLGEPNSRAESAPATIWRYSDAGCEIDVYFYLDLQSQAMRALHYEVRSHDLPERTAQRCYDALVGERRSHADSAAGSDRPR